MPESSNASHTPKITSISGAIVPESRLPAMGKRREPIKVMLWSIFTLGLYSLWWAWQMSHETQAALARDDVKPWRDLVLTVLTFGVYGIYAYGWKYPKLIVELQPRVGLAKQDFSHLTLAFSLLGLNMITPFVIQTELNKIWDASI